MAPKSNSSILGSGPYLSVILLFMSSFLKVVAPHSFQTNSHQYKIFFYKCTRIMTGSRLTFMMDDQDITERTKHCQRGDLKHDSVIDATSDMAVYRHLYYGQ